jgi:hypothetical protein
MKFGTKHSLCFNSIESKTQPSESMPTKKSCLGVMENMGRILPAKAAVVEANRIRLSRSERNTLRLPAEDCACGSVAGKKQDALVDFPELPKISICFIAEFRAQVLVETPSGIESTSACSHFERRRSSRSETACRRRFFRIGAGRGRRRSPWLSPLGRCAC